MCDGECDGLSAFGSGLAFQLLALLRNGEIGSSQSFSCVPCLFPTRCVAVRVGDPACSSLEPCVAFTVWFGRDAAKISPRDLVFPEFLVIVSCAWRQQNGYKEKLGLSRLMQHEICYLDGNASPFVASVMCAAGVFCHTNESPITVCTISLSYNAT